MSNTSATLPPPTIDSLANQFCQLLRSTLTPEQMEQVVLRNQTQTHPSVCHSGDFCDSNMVLHEVFMRYGMDVADEGGAEKWGRLWDAAWTLAKTRGFAMFKQGDIVKILEEFQDPGDDTLTWVVQDDEEKGRVDLVPLEVGGAIKPIYTVKTDWIRLAAPKTA
ncbi:MAG: hypothetical protein V4639_04490 [Pseudomonadota bacterium]